MFTDKLEIEVMAGKGGDGRLSFRHEKYRAKGGPDGGDGGNGGSVIFVVDHNLHTLSAFRKLRRIKAEDGMAGGGDRKHGRAGEDTIIKVPAGTQIVQEGSIIADLTQEEQRLVVAKGGRGGFGNAHFTSSTRQAPRTTELGEAGQRKSLLLELKLVADVGLIGLPNAGKSTLLATISNAKPEIGDYPFTTLIPNLGVVDFEQFTFLVADIPGLIEGASKGKGLGDKFLRHIERTAVLVHLIDAYSQDIVADYTTIQHELSSYRIDLTSKPQIIAFTKTEGMSEVDLAAKKQILKKVTKNTVMAISANAGQGITKLLAAIVPLVERARTRREAEESEEAIPVIDEASQPNLWHVEYKDGVYHISGQKLEGFSRRTDWENDASVERLRDILRKNGIDRELRRLEAEPGSILQIAGHALKWLG